MTNMGSSAQRALEALDDRFVKDGVSSEQRDEMMDELMWKMNERRWESDAAEKARRKFCHDLVKNLEETLRGINKDVFNYELERLDSVAAFNATKKGSEAPEEEL